MKAERLILSLIAIFIGLLVAGGAFYLYQLTKQIPNGQASINVKAKATPTPVSTNYLVIDTPQDESISKVKTITIAGKVVPASTLIISNGANDQVVSPSSTGTFSVTSTLDQDTTLFYITAIFPNGEEKVMTRTVSFVTEEF